MPGEIAIMPTDATAVPHPIPSLPRGFRLAGVKAGIKHDASREDVTLVTSDLPATAAGVYTTNLVFAAPVAYDRALTPGRGFRGIVINSGNANACTGVRGLDDARGMAAAAGTALGVAGEEVLVLSTGIIGEFLPMEKVTAGIAAAARELGGDDRAVLAAARGMMTTDTRPKLTGAAFEAEGSRYTLFAMAKGAAMIGPKMATMLAVVLTDAALDPADAQRLLTEAADDSFNCVSVDGHMSTNDTVLLLANGAAGGSTLHGSGLAACGEALRKACGSLAREMADDGEGATHVMRIEVEGCRDREEARRIARTIADSPLVKTAVHGADPNWGRIVSAAGYSGVAFEPAAVELRLNGTLLFRGGAPVPFDADAVSAGIRDRRETLIQVSVGQGPGQIRFFSSDLTADYVRLNADYHT
ncbi:MAG: bifunctional glutamate N-acetyltransferase/amino-acid acetyltransferase ArgJ [Pirellulales bacterium]|jgi:glutamate N-acetyltransferase/amino-acid N-acetyltransferase|nr:bifunctional glutamate N-acetyltransferase/amino-acid acetyltransferase ArgJ [Pirellulales bacterium]